MAKPTKDEFLFDVKDHEITILKDDGVYRHIRFEKPKSNNMAFQITTWPEYLCISGDMGCYTFSRTDDMFQFFGFRGVDGGINPGYWMEKVVAGYGYRVQSENCEEYSPDKFKNALDEIENDFIESHDLSSKELEIFKQKIEDIKCCAGDYHDAVSAIQNSNLACLDDFWDISVTDYKYHFIWCLWAIVWGISVYAKSNNYKIDECGVPNV